MGMIKPFLKPRQQRRLMLKRLLVSAWDCVRELNVPTYHSNLLGREVVERDHKQKLECRDNHCKSLFKHALPRETLGQH